MKSVDRPLRVLLCNSFNDIPAARELYQKQRAESWVQPWLEDEELYLESTLHRHHPLQQKGIIVFDKLR